MSFTKMKPHKRDKDRERLRKKKKSHVMNDVPYYNYYYPVPVPLVSIIVLCVFCPTGVYNQPSSPLSLSNPLVGEIGKG